MIHKAVYRDGVHHHVGDPSDEIERIRAAGTNDFLWIGLKDPTIDEFAEMNDELMLHHLAVEDALKGNQRPKLDVYDDSLFVVLKTLRYIEATSDVETGELMLFVGEHFVLSVRRGEANPLAVVRKRLNSQPDIMRHGPIVVLHSVIDYIVDTYRAIDIELRADLEAIEERVFADDRSVTSTDIYKLKREVLEFKRAGLPLVEPVRRLAISPETPKKLRPFFRDILDHLLQVTEHAESYDRLLSDILAAHLAQQSVRQNEDMRKISAWVAIAAMPTMIAGIYGMNFEHMPELSWTLGYPLALSLMAAVCLSLYVAFRRSGWL